MLYRDICRTLAFYLWILALPLCIPLGIAIYCEWIVGPEVYPQPPVTGALILTLLITAVLGVVFFVIGRKGIGHLYRREAILLVLIVYLITPAIGALPFFLNKTLERPLDCYFEAVSALTTTGASILYPKKFDPSTGQEIPYVKSIEAGKKTTYSFYGTVSPVTVPQSHQKLEGLSAISYALIFWRSFMQWLGGGGIIVLFVAILPTLGVGGKILYQTEVTGPSKESMLPRIKETASKLWKIYLSLTIVETVLLMCANRKISLFDAVTVSMATLSTGGLTPRSEGIAYYNCPFTDVVIMVFMILGSINFSIYFYCLRGRFSRLKDPELRTFLIFLFLACLFAAWQLTGTTPAPLASENVGASKLTFLQALRYGSFQIISAQSSTGFATANFDVWPFSVQVLMLILMFIGGMAGSTAGGIKVIRIQTFFRTLLNKIEAIYRPDVVRTYRMGSSVIDHNTATTVLCIVMIAVTLAIVGTFLLVLNGVDPETSLTTITCMANNGGFAFRMAGPTESFAFLTPFGKIISCIWMIAGRLEYYALLITLIPAFWRTTY